jgi:hypothetical protein
MNRSKSLTIILWVLGLLLVLFVSQTLAVDPYYRPANPVMDFVPQVIMNSDPCYVSVKDWPDGFPSIEDCKKCHTKDSNLYSEFYQIWGDLRSPHHKTQEAEMGQCNACHLSVVETYSVSPPTTFTSSITPTPASCENCHFWDDPFNPTIHGIGEMKTLGPYGSGMHPDKLTLGFDPNNLPSRGTHHEIGVGCWLCHPDEWNTNPYDPRAIRVCENCHSVDTLHSIQEHVTTNNIYTVNGVPNQTVTADEKCTACHGDGTTILPVCSCTFTPDNSPTPSIPRGGILRFRVDIQNNENATKTVNFATKVRLPSGTMYPHYLIGPVTVTVNANSSKGGNSQQSIPLGAPLGTYTYYGYVGNAPPPVLYDECQFNFTVVQ